MFPHDTGRRTVSTRSSISQPSPSPASASRNQRFHLAIYDRRKRSLSCHEPILSSRATIEAGLTAPVMATIPWKGPSSRSRKASAQAGFVPRDGNSLTLFRRHAIPFQIFGLRLTPRKETVPQRDRNAGSIILTRPPNARRSGLRCSRPQCWSTTS